MGWPALTRRAFAVTIVLGWVSAAGPAGLAQYDAPGGPRSAAPLTILQVNDVYSTVPVDGVGGLARVATIKQQVAEAGGTPLLMLAGDFLSSSVTSTIFKGEQMVATLNAAGLDFATLGNHEFDFGVDILLRRMSEAQWQWVVSNVLDRRTGLPLGGAEPYVVRAVGALRVGIIGLCLTSDVITRDTLERIQILDPLEAAAKYVPVLEAERADVIVALTHLDFTEDSALAERFPEIDLIVGGHEHFPITATIGNTFISKAGTDARYVARIDINRRTSGALERFFELIPVTAAFADEPRTATVANSFEARVDEALDVRIGLSSVVLDGVSARLRTSETNLGNLVADALRASVQADIGLVNSGGLRGDRAYAAGPLSRRTLLEIHPFGNVVCKIEIPGTIVTRALEHGVSRLPAPSGQFPQVSGLTMRVNPDAPSGSRVSDIRIGGVPLDADARYTLALPNYLLLGGDGYSMFEGQRVLIGPELGQPLVQVLERAIDGREIAPAVERRIVIGS
jgi:5'-nucleotidase